MNSCLIKRIVYIYLKIWSVYFCFHRMEWLTFLIINIWLDDFNHINYKCFADISPSKNGYLEKSPSDHIVFDNWSLKSS